MPLETGTTIAELDNLWPLSGDGILEGDNHLRLIKTVLKAQFPGTLGDGFNTPIIATEQEINWLGGLTGNVQSQLDALEADFQNTLYAPAGTVMVFYQAAPPTGWTQQVGNDNSMLRVVAGSGGAAGGTDDPINFDLSHVHTTAAHVLVEAELPSHSHFITKNAQFQQNVQTATQTIAGNYTSGDSTSKYQLRSMNEGIEADVGLSSSTGSDNPHEHGDTGSAGGTFNPRYISVITAVKD